jgi:tetratricopeptide (TPR) repeat protein
VLSDSTSLFNEAERLVSEGKFSAAELMLRQAVELSDDDPELFLAGLATLIGMQEGRAQESLEMLQVELERNPDSPNLLVAYGLTARSSGNDTMAAEVFQQALDVNPDHPMALHSMAQVMVDRGELGEAQKLACRAFALVPDHPQFALTAIELLEAQGEPELAFDVATLGASFNPHEMDLVQKTVKGALARSQPERAWDALEHSDEELPWVLGWKATLMDYQGNEDEADRLLAIGRKRFRRNADFLFLEAAIWERRGEHEIASEFLEKVLELDPTHRGGIQLMATVAVGNASLSEAITQMESMKLLQPGDVENDNELMTLFYSAGRFDDCLRLCRELRRRFTGRKNREVVSHAIAFECLALAAKGETQEALKLCSEVPDDLILPAIEQLTAHGKGSPGEEVVRNRLLERAPQADEEDFTKQGIDFTAEEDWIEIEEDEDGNEVFWIDVDEDEDDPDAEYEWVDADE